jgi:hypothetical protein
VFETTVQVNSKYKATDLKWDEIRQRVFSRFESISTERVTTVEASAFRFFVPNSVTPVTVIHKTKFCGTCKKSSHNEDQYFQKHPHLLEAYKKKKNKEIEEKKKEKRKEKEKEKKKEEKFHAAFAYFSYSRALFSSPSMDISKSYLDSAASGHMCPLRQYFVNYVLCDPVPVEVSDREYIYGEGYGTVVFNYSINSKNYQFSLSHTLYVPQFKFNLISVGQLLKSKFVFVLEPKPHIRRPDNLPSLSIIQERNMFILGITSFVTSQNALLSSFAKAVEPRVWHNRLDHTSYKHLFKTANMVEGLNLSSKHALDCACETCLKGKLKVKDIHDGPLPKPTEYFDVVYIDTTGKAPIATKRDALYAHLFLDRKSSFTHIFFMKLKSQVPETIDFYCEYVKVQFETKVKRIHSDRAKEEEYGNSTKIYLKRGIEHSMTTANTPAHNCVKRKIGSISNLTRCMLLHSKLSYSFWGEAFAYATRIENCLSTTSTEGSMSPWQALYKTKPDISKFRVFGCRAQMLIEGKHLKKFDFRTKEVIYLGPNLDSVSRHRVSTYFR